MSTSGRCCFLNAEERTEEEVRDAYLERYGFRNYCRRACLERPSQVRTLMLRARRDTVLLSFPFFRLLPHRCPERYRKAQLRYLRSTNRLSFRPRQSL